MTLRELLAKTGDKYDYLPDSATVEMQKEETEYWHVADYAVSSRVGNTLFMWQVAPRGWTEIEAGQEQWHTPTPWGIEQTDSHNWIGQMRPDCAKVGVIVTHTDRAGYNPNATARQDANAQFICKAVNCHDGLIKALKAIHLAATEHADLGVPMSPECVGLISKWAFVALTDAQSKARGEG